MVKKSLKSIWFWLVTLPLLYLLFGFSLLPWLIQSQLPPLLKEKYNLNLFIEHIAFNPLSYEVRIKNIALKNDAQESVIALKLLYVDYALSALFKKEIIINTFLLEEPSVELSLDTNGTLNLLTLFSAFIKPSEAPEKTTSSDSLPFNVKHFEIKSAKGKFTDFRPSTPFVFEFGPMHYAIDNLSFDKDDLSIHALTLALQNQDRMTLASSMSFDPLKVHGQLNIEHLPLNSFWSYFLPTIPASLTQGELTATLPFSLDLSKEIPYFSIEKGSFTLDRIAFTHSNQPLITAENITLAGIDIAWPDARVTLGSVKLSKPSVAMSLEKGYDLNLIKLFMPKNEPKQPSSGTEKSIPWYFALKALVIEEGLIDVVDKNAKNTKTTLSNIALILENISTDTNESISYALSTGIDKTSTLSLKGTFAPALQKIDTLLKADALALIKLQPYLDVFTPLSLTKGALSTNATLSLSFKGPLAFVFKGDITVNSLNINDTAKKSLVAWDNLLLTDVVFNTSPSLLHVKKITLNKPYVNLDIRKDKSTNFTNIIKSSPQPAKTKTPAKKEAEMDIRIGDVTLKNGSANFKDASLPIPFATLIHHLNGAFSTLDTKNSKPSVLKLEGKVDKYGYAKISGSLLPFDFKDRANLKILFKNIDMPSLTPYSGKFIGYAIQKGKLSMDLSYKIKKGLMEGDNKINLDSLTLGEKIESEEATNLPLGLAIAILKDSKGQIDIDLPVSGDLNDPDFKYGALVWKAIGNLLGSIITSPFNLIGSLLGIETETLKSIDFAAGEFELIASEEEKMEQYKQILEKKPELKLSITPSFNETLDTKGLQENAVDAKIEAMTKNLKQGEDTYSKALKELLIQRSSKEIYNTFMDSLEEQKLERGASNEALRAKIASTFIMTPEDLERLAMKRADVIIQIMTQKFAIPASKLTKSSVQPSEAVREKWVGCSVSISN